MTTPVMVERVARAMVAPVMQRAVANCLYLGDRREAFLDGIWQEAIPFAQAAIEAMREPTPAMLDAAHAVGDPDKVSVYYLWQLMIDEALK